MDNAILTEVAHVQKLFREFTDAAGSLMRKIEARTGLQGIQHPRVTAIQETVCAAHNLTVYAMLVPSRRADVSQVRQLAMHLCCELTSFSIGELALAFGGCVRNAVRHGNIQTKYRIETDKKFALKYAATRKQCEDRLAALPADPNFE